MSGDGDPSDQDSVESSNPDDAGGREAGAPPDDLTIVSIGASAGGLGALKRFFEFVPADSGLAFVVVVHLAPDHDSHLAELLQPSVAMPVLQVTETTPMAPNRVYVIPPNRNLSAIDTHLRLSPLEENRQERAPVDHFFRTVSATHDGNSVAVILTGTGSDGALGLKEVKGRGGLTIVQDPSDAEYDGMPQSAIATGFVDLVLRLDDIPDAILRFASIDPDVAEGNELSEADGQLLQRVFAQIRARTGRDFGQYKAATILRRIRRRMQLRGVEDFRRYLDLLREDVDEVATLADDLLITVSSFFRDPTVFDALEQEVIPTLFEGKAPDEDVRVWSVGCATGEEAYSLAILLHEFASTLEAPPRIQVFASDLHERSLERARQGFYPGDIESDVSRRRLDRYFVRDDGGYRVGEELRDMVVFAPHNLLRDPPFSRIDLIACRNVLIYLRREVQADVMQVFHYALVADGWLTLGTSESSDANELFRTHNRKKSLYRKRNVPAPEPRLPVFPLSRGGVTAVAEAQASRSQPIQYGALHQRLLERYAPPNLLIGPDERVIRLSDDVGRYLQHPGGELTDNVFRLVRQEFVIELRAAMHRLRETGAPGTTAPVDLDIDGTSERFVLHVVPSEDEVAGFVLVVFEPVPERPVHDTVPVDPDSSAAVLDARLRNAEDERDLARQRLQAIIEEYETSQEELKASNEELQSANEELRSTLEELETSKEELQSMNEELQTVNQENRHKVEELSQLSNDLQNLLAATNIATVFLDRELRILRFTPTFAELFNVRATDRGRPLSDITHRLGDADLAADAQRVLRHLTPIEHEVDGEDGRWYLVRLLAYRSSDDRILGVVITFVDISNQKRAEIELRTSERWIRHVSEAVPGVLFTLDEVGVVNWLNPQFEQLTGLSVDDAMGTSMWPDLVHPDDRKAATAAWASVRDAGEDFHARYRIRCGEDGYCWVMVRAVPVLEDGRVVQWFGTLNDVSAQVSAERALKEVNDQLEQRVDQRTRQVRELAMSISTAEQDARRNLGQMLHDDLQQQLYAIQMRLAFIREDAAAGEEPAEVGGRLGDLEERLEQAIEITRRLAVDLSPPLLRSDGLPEALSWLVSHMADLHQLTVTVETRRAPEIADEHLRVLLFEVARELLFNVAKHAGVTAATVTIDADGGDVVVMEVADEGAGFDPGTLDDRAVRSGLGLFNSRERLRLAGGTMEIDSAPGGGSRIRVFMPLTRPAADIEASS